MTTEDGTYFAQITDIHVGNNNLNGEAAKRNLAVALDEIASLTPTPACILATADLVCSGGRGELEEYVGIAAAAKLPVHALPANHDLWGEPDSVAWQELIGPERQAVDLEGLTVLMFPDIQRKPEGGWHALVTDEHLGWLEEELGKRPSGTCVVAFHAPILEQDGDWHDNWRDSNADAFLDVMRAHRVQALITGHWHRVNEWEVGGVRLINCGSLVGWQWTGIPPYHSFPVRAGYALYHWHGGQLRWFWRELFGQEVRPAVQLNAVRICSLHTGGPRPQVRPIEVFTRVPIQAHTCAPGMRVDQVEWSVTRGDWRPMQQTFNGLWQEWEADLDPADFRAGEHVFTVRASVDGRISAYDAVPIHLSEGRSPPLCAAIARRETVFELFYLPE